MEEPRAETESGGDCREPMEEADKGLDLSSKTETLVGEDANTVEVSDLGVGDENPNDGCLVTGDGSIKVGDGNMSSSVLDEKQEKADVEDMVGSVKGEESKTLGSVDVKRTDAITEPETEKKCEGDTGTVEVNKETAKSEVKSRNGASHETAGEEETVTPAGSEATDEKAKCEVEDNSGACDAKQNVETEKSQQKSVNGEVLSVAEDKAEKTTKKSEEGKNKIIVHSKREKESAKKSEEDNNEMDVDSKEDNDENVALHEQGNLGYETKDAKHSESAQVPEVSTQLSKDEPDEENKKEENGKAMEVDCLAEVQVEKDIKVGGTYSACNESDGASMATQDVSIAEADNNDSNVVMETKIDKRKNNTDMALTETTESADSAIPYSPTEDTAPGEVDPLDHNALFDPTSDIANFIDFTGVSSWSGNNQDLKTDTRNVSLKENKKAADMAEEIATMGIENELNEARVAFGADSPAAGTGCSKEASDEILGSEKNQEYKDDECLDKKTVDQEDTMREEDVITHDAPSIDPNQKEDTEMEENLNSDYAETGSDIKTYGVKRKADVLSDDSAGEGRKTVSVTKVSFAQRPSFKIGACIARAASQMAGSPSVVKGSNFGNETLSVESFVSQLHCAATDPVKENVVSGIAAGFFLDFRNSSASQQLTPEKASSKRARLSNSNAGGAEAFEFEEMGDTYWTDRVIHNGGEEQKPPTEKENNQVMPYELKPSKVQRTRRPYKRRQSQISTPQSVSKEPAGFDENAPAELIMKFSETDIIPPEKNLSKMFRHFGPIKESLTEVDREKHRARVVYRKSADAEVAYNSAGRFNIFGTKDVKYELNHTITETFKVQPYVVSLGEEDAAPCPPS